MRLQAVGEINALGPICVMILEVSGHLSYAISTFAIPSLNMLLIAPNKC